MPAHHPPPPRPDWAYFLDVDGTLIELAETPDAVRVDEKLLELIDDLHETSAVALISGRSLGDLKRLLGDLSLPMAGSHGLERVDAEGRHVRPVAPPPAMSKLAEALRKLCESHPGLLLEDKWMSLAVHYRQAPGLASTVHRTVQRLVKAAGAGLEIQSGKCVAEIKPSGFDKGTAVAEYLAEPPFRGRRPVFIGDDLNDEHAFAEVNRRQGISIKVGQGHSCARYRLADEKAVRDWLMTLWEIEK